VVPCYNEGELIDTAYKAIVDALGAVRHLEILFVDDGSTDDTLDRMRHLAAADTRVRYLSLTRNFGQYAAARAGFRYAAQPWIVQLDADLQFPPSETWRLLAEAAEGKDVVFGVRRKRYDPLVRRVGAVVHQWAGRRLLGIEVPRGASSFKVLRAPFARTLAEMHMDNSYFSAKVPLVTCRYSIVPVDHTRREAGRSKYAMTWLVGHAFELFFGFSFRPLNVTYLIAALGLTYAVAVELFAATGHGSVGLASHSALVVAAIVLATVTVTGRYLHRMLLSTPAMRPFYIREANIPVRPEDTTLEGAPEVPPPTRPTDVLA
jgi:glycosyltransferase involved in cell wall biosynthesis